MTFPLNFDPAMANRAVDHTAHRAVVTLSSPANIEDDIYVDFRDFAHFDGNHNDIAVVYGKHDKDGVCYAMFDTVSFFGLASSLINPRVVPVRVWCNPQSRIAVGDTAGKHMLVGQRRWWVARDGNTLTLATEAYERPRGVLNAMGMRFGARFLQMKIWRAYLQNVCDALTLSPQLTASGPTKVSPTPWVPEHPYPGCDCKI